MIMLLVFLSGINFMIILLVFFYKCYDLVDPSGKSYCLKMNNLSHYITMLNVIVRSQNVMSLPFQTINHSEKIKLIILLGLQIK